jgi:sigma-70-like protein
MNTAGECKSMPQSIGNSFDEVVLPHLDAAYRLARWIMRNDQDAEDAVQEAALRALRYFATFSGGNARAWFLRIVRNTCCGWHIAGLSSTDSFDEERHSRIQRALDPEMLLVRFRGALDARLRKPRPRGSTPEHEQRKFQPARTSSFARPAQNEPGNISISSRSVQYRPPVQPDHLLTDRKSAHRLATA